MKLNYRLITIKSSEQTLHEAQAVMEAIERGEEIQPRPPEFTFSSFEAFRKAMTPLRFALLRVIREKSPGSIQELAGLTGRDIKNVSEDVKVMVDMGLVELESRGRTKKPVLKYEGITLEVAV